MATVVAVEPRQAGSWPKRTQFRDTEEFRKGQRWVAPDAWATRLCRESATLQTYRAARNAPFLPLTDRVGVDLPEPETRLTARPERDPFGHPSGISCRPSGNRITPVR